MAKPPGVYNNMTRSRASLLLLSDMLIQQLTNQSMQVTIQGTVVFGEGITATVDDGTGCAVVILPPNHPLPSPGTLVQIFGTVMPSSSTPFPSITIQATTFVIQQDYNRLTLHILENCKADTTGMKLADHQPLTTTIDMASVAPPADNQQRAIDIENLLGGLSGSQLFFSPDSQD